MTRYGLFLQNKRLNYDAAEALFESAIDCDPANLDSLQCYSIFLDEIRNDRDKAEMMYSLAVKAVQNKKSRVSDVPARFGPRATSSRRFIERKLKDLSATTLTKSRCSRMTKHERKAPEPDGYEHALSESEFTPEADAKSHFPRSSTSGPAAARRAIGKKIDADVRFSCGQVVVDEQVGPRHAKDHVTPLHPRPWVGPLDKSVDTGQTATDAQPSCSKGDGETNARRPAAHFIPYASPPQAPPRVVYEHDRNLPHCPALASPPPFASAPPPRQSAASAALPTPGQTPRGPPSRTELLHRSDSGAASLHGWQLYDATSPRPPPSVRSWLGEHRRRVHAQGSPAQTFHPTVSVGAGPQDSPVASIGHMAPARSTVPRSLDHHGSPGHWVMLQPESQHTAAQPAPPSVTQIEETGSFRGSRDDFEAMLDPTRSVCTTRSLACECLDSDQPEQNKIQEESLARYGYPSQLHQPYPSLEGDGDLHPSRAQTTASNARNLHFDSIQTDPKPAFVATLPIQMHPIQRERKWLATPAIDCSRRDAATSTDQEQMLPQPPCESALPPPLPQALPPPLLPPEFPIDTSTRFLGTASESASGQGNQNATVWPYCNSDAFPPHAAHPATASGAGASGAAQRRPTSRPGRHEVRAALLSTGQLAGTARSQDARAARSSSRGARGAEGEVCDADERFDAYSVHRPRRYASREYGRRRNSDGPGASHCDVKFDFLRPVGSRISEAGAGRGDDRRGTLQHCLWSEGLVCLLVVTDVVEEIAAKKFSSCFQQVLSSRALASCVYHDELISNYISGPSRSISPHMTRDCGLLFSIRLHSNLK